MDKYQVTFMPDNITVAVKEDTNLLVAAKKAGIDIQSPCGGQGTCGKCAVKVVSGDFETFEDSHLPDKLKKRGYVLACKLKVKNNMIIEVPLKSRLSKHKVVIGSKKTRFTKEQDYFSKNPMNPISKKYYIKLQEPNLEDSMNDLERLNKTLERDFGLFNLDISLACLLDLSVTLRKSNWELTITVVSIKDHKEIVAIESGRSTKPAYGIAVDIGTTTVVVNLLNTENGKILDSAGTYNKQAIYGSDVISRIIYADEHVDGIQLLQGAVIGTINSLIDEILRNNKLKPRDIPIIVCGGNTVMTHMLMGVTATYLRLEPYVPCAISFPAIKSKELGININPEGRVVTIPSVASYVGGDITSGVLATMLSYSEALTLFIDIGTNGELVLGNKEWLVTCSCSAGPAFEGSGISCGMRAMDGAIDRIEINPDNLEVSCKVIGEDEPLGICGSGLIYSLSEMMEAKIIDRAGNILTNVKSSRIRRTADTMEYILIYAEASGTGHDIVITEGDIKNLLRAKGAIFAGIRTMLQMVELKVQDIERVYIAGGFGNYINITDAINIGLLPDLPVKMFEYVGNSAIQGAMIILLCQEALGQAETLARSMTYLELSIGNLFMEEFISASFIPHTDLSLFPSLNTKKNPIEKLG